MEFVTSDIQERAAIRCKICKQVFDPYECGFKFKDILEKRGRPRKHHRSEAMKKLIASKENVRGPIMFVGGNIHRKLSQADIEAIGNNVRG